MPLETSPEQPAPVRQIANLIGQWIGRLGQVWIDGQVAQLTRRPGTQTVFITLRDTAADISMQVTCPRRVLDVVDPPVIEGARVLVAARPTYYVPRGSLSMAATEIRPIGLGELLARLERLKRLLAAEGLFAPELKRRLPFLPHTVGLISGRGSAAERDVVQNSRRRWPAVRFQVENVPVQGPTAAAEMIEALQRLDRDPSVEAIVLARGGGSVEDLLPFSDEGLIRAVAGCRTPVVSAVGHEQDSPLLDLVADVRASTPTDAARQLVPDVAEESARTVQLRDRARRLLRHRVERELHALEALRGRSTIGHPQRELHRWSERIEELHDRAGRSLRLRLSHAQDDLTHQLARVRALSPKATLERGYAVLAKGDGSIVRDADQVAPGELLAARVASGRFDVTVADRAGASRSLPEQAGTDQSGTEQAADRPAKLDDS